MNICESAVRLYFDLLHGMQREDVPLMTVLPFMVFLGYEGKLEANSNMEKDLFLSAVRQLKERSNVAFFYCEFSAISGSMI